MNDSPNRTPVAEGPRPLPAWTPSQLAPVAAVRSFATLSSWIRACGPMTWIILLFIPYIFHVDQQTRLNVISKDFERKLQLAALLTLGLCQVAGGAGPIVMGIRRLLMRPSGLALVLTLSFVTIFSVVSIDPKESFAYALLTLAALALCSIAWYANERFILTCVGYLGWAICLFLLFLIAKLGWQRDYATIGGMHHNITGSAFCTAIACLHLGNMKFRWPGTLLCSVGVLASASRSSLLFLVVFLMTIAMLRPWKKMAVVYTILVAAVLAAGSVLVTFAGYDFIVKGVDSVLALSDKNRGIGSGMTGRTGLWKIAIHNISKSPLIGYGYRTRAQNADEDEMPTAANGHSSYLNMMLDMGIMGTIPLVSVVVGLTLSHCRRARDSYRPGWTLRGYDLERTRTLNRVVGAMLLATLAKWIIEPMYFNFGIPETALFFLVIVAPLAVPLRERLPVGMSQPRRFSYQA